MDHSQNPSASPADTPEGFGQDDATTTGVTVRQPCPPWCNATHAVDHVRRTAFIDTVDGYLVLVEAAQPAEPDGQISGPAAVRVTYRHSDASTWVNLSPAQAREMARTLSALLPPTPPCHTDFPEDSPGETLALSVSTVAALAEGLREAADILWSSGRVSTPPDQGRVDGEGR
ncbi:hypothetical protein [Streptosporangium saharense]|uniref:Uncharacterized protein n=1 Tax=Streptosporangium saharense TaxID=1706840 RepID=A0A7W7QHJ5_9ACTN|nr:hypothetical protein [Streptosporangium saharense]MBB4913653.1 hypothetical protein [Streptosporangium saharense]